MCYYSVHNKSGHVTPTVYVAHSISLVHPTSWVQQPDPSVCGRHQHLCAVDQWHTGMHFQQPIIGLSLCENWTVKTKVILILFNNDALMPDI